MNRMQGSTEAIEELKTTQKIEILDSEDTKIYQRLIIKHGETKDQFLQALQDNGFSEFNLGVILGLLLAKEGVKIKRKVNIIPAFLRK